MRRKEKKESMRQSEHREQRRPNDEVKMVVGLRNATRAATVRTKGNMGSKGTCHCKRS